MQAKSSSDYRYWAFISYSSKDKRWARWLHRAIETYGIPAQFISHPTPSGHSAPKRFHPLFRDRDELPASSDLGAQIEEALRASRYLIIVCSPDAAKSRWVNKEIETFRSLGRQDRVLAIIVDGEPNADNNRECFPPALRRFEPIAADARHDGDGKKDAKLKLLAGMLGVSFDAIKQRDAHRQIRRLQKILTATVLITLAFAGLAWYSFHQRNKAIKARYQAESILQYLLYDLRDMLAPVGRLDIVRDIQARVDRYYEELGIESGNSKVVENRAVAYLNESDSLFSEGKLQLSLEACQKSKQLIQRLVVAEPSNENRQWFLSVCQSEIGKVLLAQGDMAGALSAYHEGLMIRQWLVKNYPSNAAWQQGLIISQCYVGDVLVARGDLAEALDAYREGLSTSQQLANAYPGFADYQQSVVVSLCKIAEVLERQGDSESIQYWQRASDVLSKMKLDGMLINEKLLKSLKEKTESPEMPVTNPKTEN
jgi:tetratricopeptide (TPR) repeat protein